MDVKESDIEDVLGLVKSTLPSRNTSSAAFAYGDPREALLAAAHQVSLHIFLDQKRSHTS